jgi:hypothetical protein
VRAELLDGDSDLTRLADALSSPQVRLLTRGNADAGPTLEVGHETLLRVQPVRGWIEALSGQLKLRDEIEREAAEWHEVAERLKAARERADKGADLAELQRAVDAAIAARRGPRLEAALELIVHPVFARLLGKDSRARAYFDACKAHETKQIDKERHLIGRAFVTPALQALEDGRHEHALRLTAAAALLSHDPGFRSAPGLWGAAVRAIHDCRTRRF